MLDRTQAPVSRPFNHIPFPPYTTHTLSNGMEVYLMPYGSVEVLEIQAIFRVGKNHFPVPGLINYAGRMMQEGTKSYNSLQLSQTLDTYGAWISHESEEAATAFKLATTTPNARHTLPILKEIILAPLFPENEFASMKLRGIQGARINAQKTSKIATKQFGHLLFGKDHPYGLHTGEEEIQALQLDQLKDFHTRGLNPKNLMLAVVGRFEEKEILQLLEEEFGSISLNDSSPSSAPTFEHIPLAGTGRHKFQQEGLQSTVRLGHLGIQRKHPDFYKMTLLNTILGGYFGSRLMKNIREEKGYTYGIYSGFVSMKHEGVFVVQGDVGNEYVEDTIKEVKKEIKLLQDQGVDEAELSLVKNYILGKSISERETLFQIGDWLRFSLVNKISFEELDSRFDVIKGLNKEEIPLLAQKHLRPDEMLEVVVGG